MVRGGKTNMAITKLGEIALQEGEYMEDGNLVPNYLDSQRGIVNALAQRGTNLGGYGATVDGDVLSRRLKAGGKGAVVGAGAGAGAGGLVGLITKNPGMGAAIGSVLGGLFGLSAGFSHADNEILGERGIKQTGLSRMGLGKPRYTPEAAEKFLPSRKSK